MGFIDTQTDRTHSDEGEDVDPGKLQPLTEGWSAVVVPAVDVEEGALLAFLLSVGHVLVVAVSLSAALGPIALLMTHHPGEKAAASFSIVSGLAIVVAVVVAIVSPDCVGSGAVVAELAIAVHGLIIFSYAMVGIVVICAVLAQWLVIVAQTVMAGRSIVDYIAVLPIVLIVMAETIVSVPIVDSIAVLGHWHIVAHAVVRGTATTEMAVPVLIAVTVVGVVIIIVIRVIAATEQAHACVRRAG